ncbi:MAG: chemotaxis protein CheB [Lysobacteraceae bacterium]
MSASIDAGQRVQVALVSREDAARTQLRSALGDFGADVVLEQDVTSLDVGALRSSGAGVVIVSLPPDIDADIDSLQPLLDDPGIDVVFDESSVSGQLNGWDLARWARHLVAKVLGSSDTDPPRPAGSDSSEKEDFMPDPGAPPTPEQLAGEPLIEEFTIEADEHADAVPTDYMPMEDAAAAVEDVADAGLDFDLGDVESAMSNADARPEVAPTSVPDAESSDDQDDMAFDLPDADLSVLEQEFENTVEMATDPAPDSTIEAVESAPSIESISFDEDGGSDSDGISIEHSVDEAVSDPFAGTLAALDTHDSEAPADFSSFDNADDATDLGADEDVLRMAAELDQRMGEGSNEAVAEGFDSLAFDDRAEDSSSSGAAPGADTRAEANETPAEPKSGGLAFSLEDFTEGEVKREAVVADSAASPAPEASFNLSGLELEPMREDEPVSNEELMALKRVIVLGASIGGPDALRTFLAAIPKEFPALFLLAQHLESGFFGRLAEQLQKSSALPVSVADTNHTYVHGHVLVIGADRRYRLRKDGRIIASEYEEKPHYQPCIDDVLRDVADVFGKASTAIIFSGMAGDAIEGSVYMTSKGGEVWAQDSESCVVSSMVDGARSRGVVEFTGSPRELAAYCVERYGA